MTVRPLAPPQGLPVGKIVDAVGAKALFDQVKRRFDREHPGPRDSAGAVSSVTLVGSKVASTFSVSKSYTRRALPLMNDPSSMPSPKRPVYVTRSGMVPVAIGLAALTNGSSLRDAIGVRGRGHQSEGRGPSGSDAGLSGCGPLLRVARGLRPASRALINQSPRRVPHEARRAFSFFCRSAQSNALQREAINWRIALAAVVNFR